MADSWGGGSARREPKVACPHCGKMLRGKPGVHTHIKAKHPNLSRKQFAPDPSDADESFADRAVQAEIDRVCGLPTNDDWLLP